MYVKIIWNHRNSMKFNKITEIKLQPIKINKLNEHSMKINEIHGKIILNIIKNQWNKCIAMNIKLKSMNSMNTTKSTPLKRPRQHDSTQMIPRRQPRHIKHVKRYRHNKTYNTKQIKLKVSMHVPQVFKLL